MKRFIIFPDQWFDLKKLKKQEIGHSGAWKPGRLPGFLGENTDGPETFITMGIYFSF